jgi:hypothetical protein
MQKQCYVMLSAITKYVEIQRAIIGWTLNNSEFIHRVHLWVLYDFQDKQI